MVFAGMTTVALLMLTVIQSGSDGTDTGVRLKANGNNDQAVSDWQDLEVPEFTTMLMPIASALLIVGYIYRRKEDA